MGSDPLLDDADAAAELDAQVRTPVLREFQDSFVRSRKRPNGVLAKM
jgi:hypothetical protein